MLSTAGKVAIGLTVPVGVYAVVLGTLLTPYFQRLWVDYPLIPVYSNYFVVLRYSSSSLYAHKINTLFYHDINNAEQFGFNKGQVTPFTIRSPDGETLYAWHILPIDVYARHEKTLRNEKRPHGPVEDFTKTTAFRLLTSNQDPARVVVSCESPFPTNQRN